MTTQDKLKKLWNSPLFFIQNLMNVVNKNGELQKFKLNPEQKYLLKNETKYNIVLKSRQLGISTLAVAQSIYIATTQANSTCLLMSYSIQSATEIFNKLKQLYNNMAEPFKIPIFDANHRHRRRWVKLHLIGLLNLQF